MAELDVDALVIRFQERAQAVRERGLPPVAGDERRKLIQQAETDFMDYTLIGSANWSVEDDQLVLRIPLHR
jgi:hypothetical protein